ncbi:NAD(P)H-hydrate epimerase [Candidatus Woesearchaeota archaeon]|nr:NAD(P)H-hydrate epimerase [Candidatus Woesearchaeota archaeon]
MTISSQDMRILEAKSSIPRSVLMENAGRAVYRTIKQRFDLKDKKILVVCYHGNNGGDGFVAARHLCDEAETDILFIGDESKFKKEALSNFKKIEHNEKIQFLVDDEVDFDAYDIIVDAILGTGMQGGLNKVISAVIDEINNSKAYKVSVDIPTGLDPDTGVMVDKSVNADLIVTFHDIKKGLETMQEKTVVADIGLPK